MLEATHRRSEVTSICWRLSQSNKGRNKHKSKIQSGINTFWKQALFLHRGQLESFSLFDKECPRKEEPKQKVGSSSQREGEKQTGTDSES